MKRILLFLLLCYPMICFCQLGDYYESYGDLKSKGLNFKIKIFTDSLMFNFINSNLFSRKKNTCLR